MGTSEQLVCARWWSACVVAYVENGYGGDFVVSCCLTSAEGDIMVAHIEELGNLDASEISARRLDAKEVSTPKNGGNLTFLIAEGTAKLFGRDHGVREPTPRREQTCKE